MTIQKDKPPFPEPGIIEYVTHMRLLWVHEHIIIAEPGIRQDGSGGLAVDWGNFNDVP
jgi:hypothetical protein